MQVELISVQSIKPYTGNPRVISEDAVSSVSESIEKFGWQQPIVLDKNKTIVVGHTRFLAAQRLGLSEVPVTVAEDLSEDEIRAYRVLDNKLNELADWDMELLDKELEALGEGGDLASLLSIFDIKESLSSPDLEFLNDIGGDEATTEAAPVKANGDYVTMRFVMTPEDRDLCLGALRVIQAEEGLANATQALLKLLKEIK